jgi:hypothetical protein
VRVDSGDEVPEVQGVRGEAHVGRVAFGGEGEAGGGVFALQDKALAQDLVPPGVGGTLKYRVDFEVRFGVPDRGVDPFAVFEQEEVPEEGGRVLAEAAFTVGGPDILSVPDGLFGAVVEVVPEARADLGFELNGD